jgi:hypothetical protein
MQQAKDSFYMALRERLAAADPERTVVVDGTSRPAIVLEENEPSATNLEDAFRLTWGRCVRVGGGSELMKIDCTVKYATRGIDATSGDKGRALGAMDGQLSAMAQPPRATKMDYTTIPATNTGTMIFWTDLDFDEPKNEAGRIEREAKTTVYFFASSSTREANG